MSSPIMQYHYFNGINKLLKITPSRRASTIPCVLSSSAYANKVLVYKIIDAYIGVLIHQVQCNLWAMRTTRPTIKTEGVAIDKWQPSRLADADWPRPHMTKQKGNL